MWSITVTSIFICNCCEHNLCLSVLETVMWIIHEGWVIEVFLLSTTDSQLLWTNNRTSLPKKLTWSVRVTGCCPVNQITDQRRFSSYFHRLLDLNSQAGICSPGATVQMMHHTVLITPTVVIPGFYLTSDLNECWGEAAVFRAATKRLNEGVYCGVWSDPDRSLLSGLLPLSWCLRSHSFLWLSLTESKLWAQTRAGAKSSSVWKMGRWKWR